MDAAADSELVSERSCDLEETLAALDELVGRRAIVTVRAADGGAIPIAFGGVLARRFELSRDRRAPILFNSRRSPG